MSYKAILSSIAATIKAEYTEQWKDAKGDIEALRGRKHFFKNKTAAGFRTVIEHAFTVAAAANELDSFANDLIAMWRDVAKFVFNPPKDESAFPPSSIPVDIAHDVVASLLFRIRGNKNTAYHDFVLKKGLLFQDVVDEVHQQSGAGSTMDFNKVVELAKNGMVKFRAPAKLESGAAVAAADNNNGDDDTNSSSAASAPSSGKQHGGADRRSGHHRDSDHYHRNRDGEDRGGGGGGGGGGRGGHFQKHHRRLPDWRCHTEGCNGQLIFGSKPACLKCGARNPGWPAEPAAETTTSPAGAAAAAPAAAAAASAGAPAAALSAPGGDATPLRSVRSAASIADEVRTTLKHARFPSELSFGSFGSMDDLCDTSLASSGGDRTGSADSALSPSPAKGPAKSKAQESMRLADVLHAIFAPRSAASESAATAAAAPAAESSASASASASSRAGSGSDDLSSAATVDDNNMMPSVTLRALFEICRANGVFIAKYADRVFDDKVEHYFGRRVFEVIQKGLVKDCFLAITPEKTVVNLAAAVASVSVEQQQQQQQLASASASASAPASVASAETASSPLVPTDAVPVMYDVDDETKFDQHFIMLLHLLAENFHIKPDAERGIIPSVPYPGHNIAVVALHKETGRIVGCDFNQSKTDQNLCSHAEKRMCEALVAALRPTLPKLKPVKLSDYVFVSSLECCSMCASVCMMSQLGAVGFLQSDPCQMNALAICSQLFGMPIFRPSSKVMQSVSAVLEKAFAESGYPEQEITSFLGSEPCRKLFRELRDAHPLTADCLEFFKTHGRSYPGVVLSHKDGMLTRLARAGSNDAGQDNSNNNADSNENKHTGDDDDDDGMTMYTSTSTMLATLADADSDEEEPVDEDDA